MEVNIRQWHLTWQLTIVYLLVHPCKSSSSSSESYLSSPLFTSCFANFFLWARRHLELPLCLLLYTLISLPQSSHVLRKAPFLGKSASTASEVFLLPAFLGCMVLMCCSRVFFFGTMYSVKQPAIGQTTGGRLHTVLFLVAEELAVSTVNGTRSATGWFFCCSDSRCGTIIEFWKCSSENATCMHLFKWLSNSSRRWIAINGVMSMCTLFSLQSTKKKGFSLKYSKKNGVKRACKLTTHLHATAMMVLSHWTIGQPIFCSNVASFGQIYTKISSSMACIRS